MAGRANTAASAADWTILPVLARGIKVQ